MQAAVAALDAFYPNANALDDDGRDAVIELAAYAHAEWVRIHPFITTTGETLASLPFPGVDLRPLLVEAPQKDGLPLAQLPRWTINLPV